VFVRPEVIISEARGEANWMFGQGSRSSEPVHKSLSYGTAPTSLTARKLSLAGY
jgi:hypothetical protein